MKESENYKDPWKGLKIALAGVSMFFLGFAISYYFNSSLGFVVILVSLFFGAYGAILHLEVFSREMFTDPKELYKEEKKPWE